MFHHSMFYLASSNQLFNDFFSLAVTKLYINCTSGVMVSMLTLSVVDCVFKSWSDQTKDYKIAICYFSAKHVALKSKSKDWLAGNQDNVLELSDQVCCLVQR